MRKPAYTILILLYARYIFESAKIKTLQQQ